MPTGRRMPSFLIRDRSVLGRKPSSSAAPPAPSMRQPVLLQRAADVRLLRLFQGGGLP